MTALLNILQTHADGKRIALIESLQGQDDVFLSYDALLAGALRLRTLLDALHAPADAPVAILSARPLHQATAIIAGLAAGAIVNPLNPALPAAGLACALEHARPALLIVDALSTPSPAPHAGCVCVEWRELFCDSDVSSAVTGVSAADLIARPDQGGLLIYTSGTTGAPKGVLLQWAQLRANVETAITALGYRPGWISGSLLPRFHTFTLISDIFPALFLGGHAILADSFELPNAKSTVAAFKRHGVRSYSAAPIILEALCALRAWVAVPALRFAVAGAAPLKDKTCVAYRELFRHPIIPCYGLSETTCFATISPSDAIRAGSAGLPAGIDIAVFDERGRPLRKDKTGELAMRGPSVLRNGYFRDTEGRHAQAFAADGWFLSGDIGHLDADGYVYVTGRKKNMVIRGGEKIYLEDLDRCLAEQADLADCASIVDCRPESGDCALTFIVAREGAPMPSFERIAAHVRARLGPRHVPDQIYAVDAIPRTRTGKISCPDLLALLHAHHSESIHT